jgi:hypothetical protein
MPVLRLLPAILALLLLAAHFFRAGWIALVPPCIGLAALLFVRLAWVRGVAVLALALAAAEWLRTLAVLVADRMASGQPVARLVVILLTVAMATLLAALPLRSAAVRRWYGGT